MSLRKLLPSMLLPLLAASPVPALAAPGPSQAVPSVDAGGYPPVPAAPRPVEVAVKPSKGFVVVTGSDEDDHEVRVDSRDGHVTITTKADPELPWLGVVLAPEKEGLRIQAVAKDSPAARAGLAAGDVVTRVNGEPVSMDDGVHTVLGDRKPGDRIDVTVKRDGREVVLRPTLAGRPQSMELAIEDGMGVLELASEALGRVGGLEALQSLKGLPQSLCMPKAEQAADCFGFSFLHGSSGPRIGIGVEPLSDQLAEFFEVPQRKGLLVTQVFEDTPAARAGIRAGDVVVRVEDEEIARQGDIASALSGSKKGDAVTVEVLRRGRSEVLTVELDDWSFATPEHQAFEWKGSDLGTAKTLEELAAAARRAAADATSEERAAELHGAMAGARGKEIREQLEQLRKEVARLRAELEKKGDE